MKMKITFTFAHMSLVTQVRTLMLSLTGHLFMCKPILCWHIEETLKRLCSVAVAHWFLRVDKIRRRFPIYFPCDGDIIQTWSNQETADGHMPVGLKLLDGWSLNVHADCLRRCWSYYKINMNTETLQMKQRHFTAQLSSWRWILLCCNAVTGQKVSPLICSAL